jgi:hypothetical protein
MAVLNNQDYMRAADECLHGIPYPEDIHNVNDTTRHRYMMWKRKIARYPQEGKSIQLFNVNYNEINPTEESLINKYGRIYNFGFSFACYMTEDERQEMVKVIKSWREAPFDQHYGERYCEIVKLQNKVDTFIALWA